MKYTPSFSSELITQDTDNQLFKIDWAGFEPFTRGNEPLHISPKIILKSDLKKHQEFDFIEISAEDFSEENSEKIFQSYQNNSQRQKALLISFENENLLKMILFIRRLKEKIKNSKLISFIKIEEKNFEFVSYLSTFEVEYLVCEEKLVPIINEILSNFEVNSVDIFGGIPVLEEKNLNF